MSEASEQASGTRADWDKAPETESGRIGGFAQEARGQTAGISLENETPDETLETLDETPDEERAEPPAETSAELPALTAEQADAGKREKRLTTSMEAILILLLVGMLISSFMVSGTIPSLIYYGLDLLSPLYAFITVSLGRNIFWADGSYTNILGKTKKGKPADCPDEARELALANLEAARETGLAPRPQE